MTTVVWIIVAIIVLAIIIGAVMWYRNKKRTDDLQQTFGPEYDRTVHQYGDASKAENILVERRQRVQNADIRPLSSDQQQSFSDRWRDVQAEFVDDPSAAIGDADSLVQEVMQARGYPTGDQFEQNADVVSVDYPNVIENYRKAHAIAERNAGGNASTEDLRQALIHYRSLFDELLQSSNQPAEAQS